MSKNEMLIPGGGGALANVPSYAIAKEGDNNLLGDLGGLSFTRLTFKGSRFRLVKGEEETVLKTTELPVILLNAYPKVSRVYFDKAYGGDDSTDGRPKCASADGEVPLPTVARPPSDKCATCPMNQKGSAISDDGGKRRACSYYKRIVVYLIDHPDVGPVVADAKAMTLFGDSYADKGYLNLRAYADKLAQHQTKPEAVVTELSFDTNSSVPKVLFRAVSYVDEKTFREVVQPLQESGILDSLADTTQMRTEGQDDEEGEAPSKQGFRDKLIPGDKPAHATKEAKPDPQAMLNGWKADLKEALAAEDYEAAAQLKAKIKAYNEAQTETPKAAATVPTKATPAPAKSEAAVDSKGVIWNPDHHATSTKTGGGILNADGTWRARKGGPVDGAKPLVKQGANVPEKAAPAPVAERTAASRPRFCGDCGAKYGTCEHTSDEETTESADEVDGKSAFDEDLEAALREFEDD